MAYILYHTIDFQNRITSDVRIELYKKDGDPDFEVTQLTGISAKRQPLKGQGLKFDTIIASELSFSFRLPFDSTLTYDDFIVSFHDEWMVKLFNEGNIEFIGYLIPYEGQSQFRDLPYVLDITATDGLGFLKTDDLSKVDGSAFTGTHTLMEYITGILVKTRLQLNIRTYCNIYEVSMPDRNTDPQADMLNLAKQDYRTYQNDDGTPMACYNALGRMLAEGFSIYQWFGKWVIFRIGELQGSTGPKLWFTEYDYTGTVVDAQLEGLESGRIAKDQVIHPILADQTISALFAIKYAKHIYNYTPWPELPKNNKFERGTAFEEGDQPDDDDLDKDGNTSEIIGTYKKYTIDNWEQGVINVFALPQPPVAPTGNKFYRRSTYNEFGVEIDRRVIGESFNTTSGSGFGNAFILRSEGIPVKKGGRINVGLQKKFDNNFSGSGTVFTTAMTVYIVKSDNSAVYYMDNNVGGSQQPTARWRNLVNFGQGLILDYAPNQDTREWNTISVESLAIPFDGTVYMQIAANGPTSNTGARQHFKDITIEYLPYIAGGYIPVKGDSWETQQNLDYKDNVTEEVFTSDSQERIFKGALLRNDGVTLTESWHRLNVDEDREYKELINIARYNAAYRRFKQIQGTFRGTTCRPVNALTEIEPLGFHRHFMFTDDPVLTGKHFVLVPPLTIDYGQGRINAVFVEAYDENTDDGNELGDIHQFKFIF